MTEVDKLRKIRANEMNKDKNPPQYSIDASQVTPTQIQVHYEIRYGNWGFG